VYASEEELTPADLELMQEARRAASKAYAKYSFFRVGSALRDEYGYIHTGNNQENIAYPSGLCAERVALFATFSENPDIKLQAIAITALPAGPGLSDFVSPCGACRQVMSEYETRQQSPIRVLMEGPGGSILEAPSLDCLMPFSFKMKPFIQK